MSLLVPNFLPLIASAANGTNPTVKELVFRISFYVLNPLIRLGFVIAVLYFMYGVVMYIADRNAGHIGQSSAFGGSNEAADRIVYGFIGLIIMVSVFGIMNLIKNLTGSKIDIPA